MKNHMNIAAQIATHFRAVYFGGNWTSVNLRDTLADVTWKQASAKVYSFNTIGTLVYHMNYYVIAVLGVLNGKPLDAKDKYSFEHPPILSEDDWQKLLDKFWAYAEDLARMIGEIPEIK